MIDDGSSNEERLRTGRRYRTDRTEGISDGVFAVSLTLLILDARPPEGGVSQLVHGLVLIAPRLGTFALSFAIVGYYWLVHHLIFASLRGVKVALIWANMLFLFTIAVLPFWTAVLGSASSALSNISTPPSYLMCTIRERSCSVVTSVGMSLSRRYGFGRRVALRPGQSSFGGRFNFSSY